MAMSVQVALSAITLASAGCWVRLFVALRRDRCRCGMSAPRLAVMGRGGLKPYRNEVVAESLQRPGARLRLLSSR